MSPTISLTKDALQFLMTREITHMKAFAAALESMNKPRFMIGKDPPTPGLVDQFFNTSTGQGEDGEIDARGPWNQGEELELVEAPAFQALTQAAAEGAGDAGVDDRTTSSAGEPEMIEDLLVDQLRDLPHAEGQLVKAPPKMAKPPGANRLRPRLKSISRRRRRRSNVSRRLSGWSASQRRASPVREWPDSSRKATR